MINLFASFCDKIGCSTFFDDKSLFQVIFHKIYENWFEFYSCHKYFNSFLLKHQSFKVLIHSFFLESKIMPFVKIEGSFRYQTFLMGFSLKFNAILYHFFGQEEWVFKKIWLGLLGDKRCSIYFSFNWCLLNFIKSSHLI